MQILPLNRASIQEPGDEISADTIQEETQKAIELLADLQLRIEPTKIAETESKAKSILTGLGFSDVPRL